MIQRKIEREASPINEIDDFFKGTMDFFKRMFGMTKEEEKEEEENREWKSDDEVSEADSVETKTDT